MTLNQKGRINRVVALVKLLTAESGIRFLTLPHLHRCAGVDVAGHGVDPAHLVRDEAVEVNAFAAA